MPSCSSSSTVKAKMLYKLYSDRVNLLDGLSFCEDWRCWYGHSPLNLDLDLDLILGDCVENFRCLCCRDVLFDIKQRVKRGYDNTNAYLQSHKNQWSIWSVSLFWQYKTQKYHEKTFPVTVLLLNYMIICVQVEFGMSFIFSPNSCLTCGGSAVDR